MVKYKSFEYCNEQSNGNYETCNDFMQCLKLIKKHKLGSMKRTNVHYSSPLHPRPALEKTFWEVHMIV